MAPMAMSKYDSISKRRNTDGANILPMKPSIFLKLSELYTELKRNGKVHSRANCFTYILGLFLVQ